MTDELVIYCPSVIALNMSVIKFLIFKNQNLGERKQYFKYKNHCAYDVEMVFNFLKYFIRNYDKNK